MTDLHPDERVPRDGTIVIKNSGDYEHARAKRDQHLQMARTLQNEIARGAYPGGLRGRIDADLAEAKRYQTAMEDFDGTAEFRNLRK